MKRVLVFCLSLFLFSLLASPVEAHFGGLPVIKINGKFTTPYTLDVLSIGDVYIPSDAAPGNYLVNKPVTFEVDEKKLPFPEEVTKQSTYSWDFGDGSKTQGEKVTHRYKKIGSHELTLVIDFGNLDSLGYGYIQETKQPPQTVMLHILPDSSYKLPKAVITINGKQLKNSTKDTFKTVFKDKIGPLTFGKTFSFDASNSQSSARIVSYLWDFGDVTTGKKIRENHSYEENYYMRNPALRIVDENGFISDAFTSMINSEPNFDSDERFPISTQTARTALLIIVGIITAAIIVGWKLLRKR